MTTTFGAGGGIHGYDILRVAAGRGYRLGLCEKRDGGQWTVILVQKADPGWAAIVGTRGIPTGSRLSDRARAVLAESRRRRKLLGWRDAVRRTLSSSQEPAT